MTPEQAAKLAGVIVKERARIEGMVDDAFADQSNPLLVKPLISEFLMVSAMTVHMLAEISESLKGVHAEMVKANQPAGMMSTPKKE